MPTRNASAVWEGGLKGGKGSFRTDTGLSGSYSAGSRFESVGGSNPEELLAAAHAACFSMALSGSLERNGTPPERVETSGACSIERVGEGFTITTMRLKTRARVPDIDADTFQRIAAASVEGCPVSRALAGVKIEVDATLDS